MRMHTVIITTVNVHMVFLSPLGLSITDVFIYIKTHAQKKMEEK